VYTLSESETMNDEDNIRAICTQNKIRSAGIASRHESVCIPVSRALLKINPILPLLLFRLLKGA